MRRGEFRALPRQAFGGILLYPRISLTANWPDAMDLIAWFRPKSIRAAISASHGRHCTVTLARRGRSSLGMLHDPCFRGSGR